MPAQTLWIVLPGSPHGDRTGSATRSTQEYAPWPSGPRTTTSRRRARWMQRCCLLYVGLGAGRLRAWRQRAALNPAQKKRRRQRRQRQGHARSPAATHSFRLPPRVSLNWRMHTVSLLTWSRKDAGSTSRAGIALSSAAGILAPISSTLSTLAMIPPCATCRNQLVDAYDSNHDWGEAIYGLGGAQLLLESEIRGMIRRICFYCSYVCYMERSALTK